MGVSGLLTLTIMLSLTMFKRTENERFLGHLIYSCFTLQATVSEVETTEVALKGDRYKAKSEQIKYIGVLFELHSS